MAISSFSTAGNATVRTWDEELTFSVLTSRARRKLLVALATGGPQTGPDLKHIGKGSGRCKNHTNFVDSTLKHLKLMIKAGIVVQLENPQNGRRPLHVLAPGIKVTTDGGDTVIDFEFIEVQLSADGN